MILFQLHMKSTKKNIPAAIIQNENSSSFIKDVNKLSIGELIERYAYAEAIVETVREPLVILDENLRIKTANKAFLDTFKITTEETYRKYIYELNSGEWNIPELQKLLENILPQNTVFNDFEVTHDFERIGRRTMLLNARRIILEEHKTELILLAIEDITARRILEQQKNDFINIASHELKTPLSSIKPFVQLLEKRLKESGDEKDNHMIEHIAEQIDNMAKLANQLLDLGKIEENKVVIKKKGVINELVKKVIKDIQHTTNTHEIILQEAKKNILAPIDEGRIKEVLNNLLTNAIKYAPEGKKIFVNISTTKKEVITSVQDFGEGIAKEDIPMIFNRFYQTKKHEARALGLAYIYPQK